MTPFVTSSSAVTPATHFTISCAFAQLFKKILFGIFIRCAELRSFQAFAYRLNGEGKECVSAALKALAVQRQSDEGVKAMSVSLLGQCLRSCGNFKLAFSVMAAMRQPAIDPNGIFFLIFGRAESHTTFCSQVDTERPPDSAGARASGRRGPSSAVAQSWCSQNSASGSCF